MGAPTRGGGDSTQGILKKPDIMTNGPLPNINIALPPPPPSNPPITLPSLDRLLTPATAFDRHLTPSSTEGQSTISQLPLDADPDWSAARVDHFKATDMLSAPLMDTTSDSTITDHLLLLLQKHNQRQEHQCPQPVSDSSLEPSSFFATDSLRYDTHDAVKTPLESPNDGVIKSAAWLDRLMSGSTQDVFSDVSPFRPTDPGFLQPNDVFSDLVGGVNTEQPPSPLQKFHSWQQGHSLGYPQPPETAQRLLSDQTRLTPPPPFSGQPSGGIEQETGLTDILGMLTGQRMGRERASSLPQADLPTSPPPQSMTNALQVPEAANRLWSSAENLSFGIEGPPSPNAELHRRLQQAASMELQRHADGDAVNTGRTPTSPPPPPRSRKAPAKGWWKTEVCKFWKEGTGCRNGANCRWAHGDQELRRMEDPSPRGDGEAVPAPGFTLSPSALSRPTWSHERLLLDPLPRPSVSPSMNIRGLDEQSGSVLSGSASDGMNRWTILPINYLVQTKRVKALEEVWQLVRMKSLPYLSLMENLLIASAPGIRVDVEYWEDLLDTLAGIDPEDRRAAGFPMVGLRRCIFCGSPDPTVREANYLLQSSGIPEQCPAGVPTPLTCDRCAQIAENKAHCSNLFPTEITSYDSEDRSTVWGYKLAQFMRSCEDGSWLLRNEHGNLLRKGQTVDLWVQHQRYIARVWFVLHIALRAAEGPRRLHFQNLHFLDTLSLVEWTAVAHQPVLFAILLLSSFPVSRSSVPSSLASMAIPLDSWKNTAMEYRSAPPRPRFLAPPRNSEQPISVSSGKGTTLGTPSKRSTSPTGTATPVDADLTCVAAGADDILLGDDFSCYKALVE